MTGQEAFELYDTYGFPVDLTEIEASEHGFTVDLEGFATEMASQRSQSKKAAKFQSSDGGEWTQLSEGAGRGFAGYGLTQYETRVQRYRVDGDRVEFVLDRTPFYAESGGEVADHGWIEVLVRVTVDDVQRITGVTHFRTPNSGSISLTPRRMSRRRLMLSVGQKPSYCDSPHAFRDEGRVDAC